MTALFVLILIGHISTLHHHSVYYLVSQNVVNHLRVLNVNNLIYKKTKIHGWLMIHSRAYILLGVGGILNLLLSY